VRLRNLPAGLITQRKECMLAYIQYTLGESVVLKMVTIKFFVFLKQMYIKNG
jgi:hypothetical protein